MDEPVNCMKTNKRCFFSSLHCCLQLRLAAGRRTVGRSCSRDRTLVWPITAWQATWPRAAEGWGARPSGLCPSSSLIGGGWCCNDCLLDMAGRTSMLHTRQMPTRVRNCRIVMWEWRIGVGGGWCPCVDWGWGRSRSLVLCGTVGPLIGRYCLVGWTKARPMHQPSITTRPFLAMSRLKVPSLVLANWWNLGLTFVSKWMI
jgi:hypothetical protein